MVFDGQKLGSKGKTEEEREKNRIENRKKADEYFQNQEYEKAQNYYAVSVDVTLEMAEEVKKAL